MGSKGEKVTLDDLIELAKPRRESVRLSLRSDLFEKHAELERDLAAARVADEGTNEPNRAPAIAEEIKALEAEMAESESEFLFESLGRRAWTDLLSKFPPTDEHRKLGLDFDPDRFPYEAMAASMKKPSGVTPEKVKALADRLTVGQYERLWGTCCLANMGVSSPGNSRAASAVLRGLRQNSEPPSDSALPDPSSSDE